MALTSRSPDSNSDWLFAEPAPRARRRERIAKAACIASSFVVVAGCVLALLGYTPALLATFGATIVTAATGVEAYWAGEIARRAAARDAAAEGPRRAAPSRAPPLAGEALLPGHPVASER